MELRASGIFALLVLRRGRLDPAQLFLLGGAIAGPAMYLTFAQTSGGNEYFTRSGFPFAVMLSAWGFALVYDRARPTRRLAWVLGVGAAVLAVALVVTQIRYATSVAHPTTALDPLVPLLLWSAGFALVIAVFRLLWEPLCRLVPALRGRGAAVALTAILVFGAPGLIMDMYKGIQHPNGGAYFNIYMPRSKVEAARWVRDHSRPNDVLATNSHCLPWGPDVACDPRVFWLSAYAERSVLVEGWGFAPRTQSQGTSAAFWKPEVLELGDRAIAEPTPAALDQLYRSYGVRFLVVDRGVSAEGPELRQLADQRFDNGAIAVYQIRP
jgi:hypothetical protein